MQELQSISEYIRVVPIGILTTSAANFRERIPTNISRLARIFYQLHNSPFIPLDLILQLQYQTHA